MSGRLQKVNKSSGCLGLGISIGKECRVPVPSVISWKVSDRLLIGVNFISHGRYRALMPVSSQVCSTLKCLGSG